jgi:hypothetical protein
MRRASLAAILSMVLFAPLASNLCFAEDSAQAPPPEQQVVASSLKPEPPPAPEAHRFWDRENLLLFSSIAVTRGLDYASTRNMQARGRKEILLAPEVVNNSAAFASLEAAGTLTSIGISYIFHRTGHHKLERWLSISHISVAAFGDVRNYCLKTRRR